MTIQHPGAQRFYPTVPADYSVKATGEIAGNTSATVCPTVACRLVKFKALYSNAGFVCLGFTSGVTMPDGTTDATTGFELGPGDETPFLPCANMNEFYRISTNSGDDLTYIALG